MLLKKKNVFGFVIIIAVALCGLLIVQTLLIRAAYISKDQAFKRNILASLGAVSQNLATREVVSFAFDTDSISISDTIQSVFTINVSHEIYEDEQ